MLANKAVIVLCISMLSVSYIAGWFTQKPSPGPTTGEDQSSDDSSLRSMTSTTNNSFPEEESGTDDNFTEEKSGSPTLTPGDDFSEVTPPSPVTTTEDFAVAEPASTTVANDKASEKIGSAGQNVLHLLIIAVSICVVFMVLILLVFIKMYCILQEAS